MIKAVEELDDKIEKRGVDDISEEDIRGKLIVAKLYNELFILEQLEDKRYIWKAISPVYKTDIGVKESKYQALKSMVNYVSDEVMIMDNFKEFIDYLNQEDIKKEIYF